MKKSVHAQDVHYVTNRIDVNNCIRLDVLSPERYDLVVVPGGNRQLHARV
jgi:putative intracellular protease/amidase